MLFQIYVFALVVGGILLAASMFLGGEDADADAGDFGDADGGDLGDADGGEVDHGHQMLDSAVDSHGSPAGFLTTFLSLRFWTFFMTFFGATGLIFDGLELAAPPMTPIIAGGMGLVTGYVTVAVIRSLSKDVGGKVATAADYVGKSGRVLLPIRDGDIGKIRLEVGGTTVDMLATSADGQLATGDEALVIEMNGTTAVVSRMRGRNAEE